MIDGQNLNWTYLNSLSNGTKFCPQHSFYLEVLKQWGHALNLYSIRSNQMAKVYPKRLILITCSRAFSFSSVLPLKTLLTDEQNPPFAICLPGWLSRHQDDRADPITVDCMLDLSVTWATDKWSKISEHTESELQSNYELHISTYWIKHASFFRSRSHSGCLRRKWCHLTLLPQHQSGPWTEALWLEEKSTK